MVGVSSAGALTITTNNVTGGFDGVAAVQFATGALSITTNGAVQGLKTNGIYANNNGSSATIKVAAGSTVTGATNGLYLISAIPR